MSSNSDQKAVRLLEKSVRRIGETIDEQGLEGWFVPNIAKLSLEAEMAGEGGHNARKMVDQLLEKSLRLAVARIETAGHNGLSQSRVLKVKCLLSAVRNRHENPGAVIHLAYQLVEMLELKAIEALELHVRRPENFEIVRDLLEARRQWAELRSGLGH